MSYSDDSLRQLLELRDQPGGYLSPDQIEALIAWDQTPDTTRRELEAEQKERGPAPVSDVAPLTPQQTEYLRDKGLIEEEPSASPSLLDRIRSVFRRS